jgi:acetate kinase
MNAGSSSHKLSLYDLVDVELTDPLWNGMLDWGREGGGCSLFCSSRDANWQKEVLSGSIDDWLEVLLATMLEGETKVIGALHEIERVGHRVVHGGVIFEQPVLIDAEVKEQIRCLIPLAPLHNPHSLKGIEWMEKLFPGVPQIAVFDTAFHATMSDEVKTYPLPIEWKKKGVQRFGFHGISHQYCAERIANLLDDHSADLKIINCHLGNGCSLCAIKGGQSIDTTMGMTPLEGLMMGSRSGSVDPGILLYLMREHQVSLDKLEEVLNHSSGLKGIAGSSDMRDLLERKGDEKAILAVKMFIHRLKAGIGAMAGSLGGVDVLSFTGGIGENAVAIREELCFGLAFLGVAIDSDKNLKCNRDVDISLELSNKRVFVLHTREEWMIARFCYSYFPK